jgi:hypothetical protein
MLASTECGNELRGPAGPATGPGSVVAEELTSELRRIRERLSDRKN